MITFKVGVPDNVTKDATLKLLQAQWPEATVELAADVGVVPTEHPVNDTPRKEEAPSNPPSYPSPTGEAAELDRKHRSKVDEQITKDPLKGMF